MPYYHDLSDYDWDFESPAELWQGILENWELMIIPLAALYVITVLPVVYSVRTIKTYYPLDLKTVYHPFLARHPYYLRLSPQHQKRFRRRMQLFINTKTFIARSKGFKVSDEIRAGIAAAAVEITFGFRKFGFEHFSRILIYPDDYYSKITRRYHRGEVNPRGFIILSWKAFQEGYATDEDGINLGIHEMAHAVKLENRIHNGDYQFIAPRLLDKLELHWRKFAEAPREDSLLRAYGHVNRHEFFAVACENFLERPAILKRHDPDLYHLMVSILRQDPLELWAQSSPVLSTASPIQRY